jgi:SnoaL-like protein
VTINTLATWHQLVARRDAAGLGSLLAEDVIFHSPVVHTAQVGKAVTTRYLAAAFRIIGNDSFRYVRELAGDRDAVLEFEVDIESVIVNGVDMIKWDADGRIIDFKVMLRPLKAINLVHQKMGALLEAMAAKKPAA